MFVKLTQLQYFYAICNSDYNITRAAEQLHVSQPGISNAIKELEGELEVTLFRRENKRLQLTQEGEIFRSTCENILQNVDLLYQQMKDVKKRIKRIRLGITPVTGMNTFCKLISEFSHVHPDIELNILDMSSPEILEQLNQGAIDIGIANLRKNWPAFESIEVINLYENELLFCTYLENPLAKVSKVTRQMIVGEPLALYQTNTNPDDSVLKRFAREGLIPNIRYYFQQIDMIKAFIANGILSSLMFEGTLLPTDPIVSIPFVDPIIAPVGLLYKRSRSVSNETYAFIDFVQEYFTE